MQCGETGHLKCFSTASTWCKFCVIGTHSTKVCRQYANFMTDNPIASSRRMTPVQEGIPQRGPVQNEVPSTDVQQAGEPDQRQLFPQPPTQWFQPPVVPLVETQRVQQPTVLPSPQHLPPNRGTSVKIELVRMSTETLFFNKVLHHDINRYNHPQLK